MKTKNLKLNVLAAITLIVLASSCSKDVELRDPNATSYRAELNSESFYPEENASPVIEMPATPGQIKKKPLIVQ